MFVHNIFHISPWPIRSIYLSPYRVTGKHYASHNSGIVMHKQEGSDPHYFFHGKKNIQFPETFDIRICHLPLPLLQTVANLGVLKSEHDSYRCDPVYSIILKKQRRETQDTGNYQKLIMPCFHKRQTCGLKKKNPKPTTA